MKEELKADVDLLLECMHCQLDSPTALKQALLAVADMCSTKGDPVREYLRKCSGLKFMLKLLTTVTYHDVKLASMYSLGCAVDRNVYSQRELCTPSLFSFLHDVLSQAEINPRYIQTTSFLILTIVANNNAGQVLVKKSGCLEYLLKLFKSSLPVLVDNTPADKCILPDANIELWSSVASALSVCVNNPCNEENQRLSSAIFPFAFRVLEVCQEMEIIKKTSALVGIATANNIHNQERVRHCGGMEVLLTCLYRLVNRFKTELDTSELTSCIQSVVNCLDSVVTDHVENADSMGKLGGVAILLQLLRNTSLPKAAKIQVIVTLGHCTDSSGSNQMELVELGGVSLLIKELTLAKDEELSHAIKYVLQACVHVDAKSDHNIMKSTGCMSKVNHMISGRSGNLCKELTPDYHGANLEKDIDDLEKTVKNSPHITDHAMLGLYNKEITRKLDILEKKLDQSLLGDTDVFSGVHYLENSTKKADKTVLSTKREHSVKPVEKNQIDDSMNSNLWQSNAEANVENTKEFLTFRENFICDNVRPASALMTQCSEEKILNTVNEMELSNNLQDCVVLLDNHKNNGQHLETSKHSDHVHSNTQPVLKQCVEGNDSVCTNNWCSCQLYSPVHNIGCNQCTYCHRPAYLTREICCNDRSHVNGVCSSCNIQTRTMSNPVPHYQISSQKVSSVQCNPVNLVTQSEKSTAHSQVKQHAEPCKTQLHSKTTIQNNTDENNQTSFEQPQCGAIVPDSDILSILNECIGPVEGQNKFTSSTQSSPLDLGNAQSKPEKYLKALAKSKSNEDISKDKRHQLEPNLVTPMKKKIVSSGRVKKNTRYASQGDHAKDLNRELTEQTQDLQQTHQLNCNESNSDSSSSGREEKTTITQSQKDQFIRPSGLPPAYRYKSKTRFSRRTADSFVEEDNDDISVCGSVFDDELIKCANYTYRASHFIQRHTIPLSQSQREEDDHNDDDDDYKLMNITGRPCHKPKPDVSRKHRAKPVGSGQRNSWPPSRLTSKHISKVRTHSMTDVVFSSATHVENIEDDSGATENTNNDTSKLLGRVSGRRCPGCQPPVTCDEPLLNSYIYNIAMETSCYTCSFHREFREQERQFIKSVKHHNPVCAHRVRRTCSLKRLTQQCVDKAPTRQNVYDIDSNTESLSCLENKKVTPPYSSDGCSVAVASTIMSSYSSVNCHRKARVPYAADEERDLLRGVALRGHSWQYILYAYKFHPTRTAVDLKEKYRRMMAKETGDKSMEHRSGKPFSMAEHRRLLRGVRKFGHNWRTILASYCFNNDRKSVELRDKWRSLHRN